MKLQGQDLKSATAFGWIGDDFLASVQVFFFLALGFVVTSKCMRVTLRCKLPVKKVEDDGSPLAKRGMASSGCEEEVVSPSKATAKARRSNAQERKRDRKAKLSDAREQVDLSIEVPLASAVTIEETIVPQVVALAEEHAFQVVAKKSERKNQRGRAQKGVAPQIVEKKTAALASSEMRSDSDSLSQDGQTTSTLSGVSAGVDSCESDTSVAVAEPNDGMAEIPDVGHCQTPEDSAKMPTTLEGVLDSLQINTDGLRQQMGVSAETLTVPVLYGEHVSSSNEIEIDGHVNFDGVRPDMEAFGDHEHISTPDEFQGFPEMASAPIICYPEMTTMLSTVPQMMPQADGWVAVAMPAEYAPNGAFDGYWKNNEGENISIDKLNIAFESGVSWDMEMHSLTSISVHINGQEHRAEFDGLENLLWSDGDVWIYVGPHAQQDASMESSCISMPFNGIASVESPCMSMPFNGICSGYMEQPFSAEVAAMEEVQMPMMSQCIPKNAKNWETCWDWSKKGFCPRGAKCDWYHPVPESSFF